MLDFLFFLGIFVVGFVAILEVVEIFKNQKYCDRVAGVNARIKRLAISECPHAPGSVREKFWAQGYFSDRSNFFLT